MKKIKTFSKEQNDALTTLRQADRLEELRAQNAKLQQELDEYKKRERQIEEALTFAKKAGDEYVALVKVKYALECERIERFRKNLERYRDKEQLLKAFDNDYEELRRLQTELEKSMNKGFGSVTDDYYEEKERLHDDNSVDYGDIIDGNEDLLHADKISDEDLKELLEQL